MEALATSPVRVPTRVGVPSAERPQPQPQPPRRAASRGSPPHSAHSPHAAVHTAWEDPQLSPGHVPLPAPPPRAPSRPSSRPSSHPSSRPSSSSSRHSSGSHSSFGATIEPSALNTALNAPPAASRASGVAVGYVSTPPSARTAASLLKETERALNSQGPTRLRSARQLFGEDFGADAPRSAELEIGELGAPPSGAAPTYAPTPAHADTEFAAPPAPTSP